MMLPGRVAVQNAELPAPRGRYKRRQARFSAPSAQELTSFELGGVQIDFADAMDRYQHWPAPTVIIVDGPYGVGGFPGDPPTPRELGAWYEPHVKCWAELAQPSTTLWFWGTELGWANAHAVSRSTITRAPTYVLPEPGGCRRVRLRAE